MAHHAGQDKQRILPFAIVDTFAVFIQNAAIIGVHEGIRAALKLVVDVRCALKIIRTGAATADDVTVETVAFQPLNRIGDLSDGRVQLGPAVSVEIKVLHRA